jgi:hypothetical protein
MKKQITDRLLLLAGVLLLLCNLVYNVWWKDRPTTANLPVRAASASVAGTNNDVVQQLLSAGLIAHAIQWNDTLHVVNEQGARVAFNQVLGADTKLVFRFSELSCNTCVDREVGNLKKMAAQVGADKIVVLASYRNLRDLVVFKRINQLDFQVYNAADKAFPADAAGGTFVFLANQVHRGFAPFIPSKEIDDLSPVYYDFAAPLLASGQ